MAIRADKSAGGATSARRPHLDRAISPVQAARFVLALRDGETVAAAAARAGVAATTFYYRRKVDAAFAACWADAVAGAGADAAAGRAAARAEQDAAQGTMVVEHARRWLVRKRRAPVEFTRARRQTFLDRFADGCNLKAAAAAAGVSVSSVHRRLRRDPAFAAGFQAALAIGYEAADEEALREARAAQEAYRIAPSAESAALSFDRAMAVLREYKRGFGQIGRRPYARRPAMASFKEGFAALERELDRLAEREALKPARASGAGEGAAVPPPGPGTGPEPRIRGL